MDQNELLIKWADKELIKGFLTWMTLSMLVTNKKNDDNLKIFISDILYNFLDFWMTFTPPS